MRRQIELIRQILAFLAERDETWVEQRIVLDALDGHAKGSKRSEIVDYHIDLCLQAGFLAREQKDPPPFRLQITWQGHEFLAPGD